MGGGRWWRPMKTAEEVVVEPFRLITAALLSLLLPLSFLLLSRLSSAAFILSLSATSSPPPQQTDASFFFSIFLYTNPAILYAIVSSVSVYTLVHGLTTKIATANTDRSIIFYPRVGIAWLILFLLQVSVGLGLEGTISEGVNGVIIGKERNFLSKIVFFLGLHEVMLLWYRVIVRPVVDDTLLGECRDRGETLVERAVLAVSCGTLWWWKLRDEVEALVGVAEAKRALLLSSNLDSNINYNVEVGMVDFVNWWLYYMVVTIGMVRIVKGSLWVGMILLFERVRRNPRGISASSTDNDHGGDDGKV
ncbi:PREDICTED: uncharacterized protein LOC104802151 [Tarenaya hassleriana]|uniref:uncharacterized protein LOC104802151 n=1 Tax=Tarenaya hassleriana TaxID=28532 RepID=UPI00053C4721|nr:PREDICTED: uncharacterized protein LOC104802151 [Tarenaya hassleriana]